MYYRACQLITMEKSSMNLKSVKNIAVILLLIAFWLVFPMKNTMAIKSKITDPNSAHSIGRVVKNVVLFKSNSKASQRKSYDTFMLTSPLLIPNEVNLADYSVNMFLSVGFGYSRQVKNKTHIGYDGFQLIEFDPSKDKELRTIIRNLSICSSDIGNFKMYSLPIKGLGLDRFWDYDTCREHRKLLVSFPLKGAIIISSSKKYFPKNKKAYIRCKNTYEEIARKKGCQSICLAKHREAAITILGQFSKNDFLPSREICYNIKSISFCKNDNLLRTPLKIYIETRTGKVAEAMIFQKNFYGNGPVISKKLSKISGNTYCMEVGEEIVSIDAFYRRLHLLVTVGIYP